MLILSRKKEESLWIGEQVQITVVDIRGDKVRLGVKAPQHIPVHREEVLRAMQRAGESIVSLAPLAASHVDHAPESITGVVGCIDEQIAKLTKHLALDPSGLKQIADLETSFIQLLTRIDGAK